ncbi:MAG: nucleotidyl transferase AbiEii/AbiGii toxin family protein, partial [Armatimonadetes bacterium]|nr:nucleotidyl transferase AbiEii/AbiGii toxin family protein [Armatimonadota bacterium]
EFEILINKIKVELKRIGIDFNIRFKHWENIYAAHLIFPYIEKAYNAVSNYSKKKGIIIKIEINKPSWKVKKQTEVISGFGEFYPCICTDIGALFADKIDALKKTRARHIYDIMFMLSNQYPINKDVLLILGIKDDPLVIIMNKIISLTKFELRKQAENLRLFLFEESESDLIINAHDIIPSLLEKYRKQLN